MYELLVSHNGNESAMYTVEATAILGWEVPCINNVNLKTGDELSVQIRGWYADGTVSDWSDEAPLSTREARGCSVAAAGPAGTWPMMLWALLMLRLRRPEATHPNPSPENA